MRGVLWYSTLTLLLGQWGAGQKTEPQVGQRGHDLFRGSDHYDFAIVLPATRLECFWHFAHQSGRFYLTYMVQWVTGIAGGDRQLYVTVISPEGILMASSDDAIGQINFQTEETGFYEMCLANYRNNFGGMQIFLSFGVYYEGFLEAKRESEKDKRALNSTLSNIEVSTNKIQAYIVHMWRHSNYARMRRGADHYLLISNSNYVSWWSAAQSLVIVMAGYLQLLFLKRLFLTDSNKPRC